MNTGRTLIATIGGFAALGFAILAIIYSVAISNPPPELSPTSWDWTLRILVIAAIVSFSAYLLAAPETIGEVAARRSTRFTTNALVASFVAIVIAVLLNVIADRFATARADLTANKTFTQSDQTIKILEGLKTDVTAVGLYLATDQTGQATSSRQQMEDLFKSYQSHSSHFKYKLVDVRQDPITALSYLSAPQGGSPSQPPAVVFDNGKKRETTHDLTETGFTTALIKLDQTTQPTVAFLTGHGERAISDSTGQGYSQVSQQLTKESYSVTTANLLTSTLSVSQTTVLVIAAPQRPLTGKEIEAVQRYLDSGGRALIILDPALPTNTFDSLKPIIQKYGVTAVQGAIVDAQSEPQLGAIGVIVNQYPSDSEITRELQQNHYQTLFPASAGLKPPTSTVGGFQTTSIVQSSAGQSSVGEQLSYLDTSIKPGMAQNYQTQYKAGVDIPGPVSMGVTIAPQNTTTSTVRTRLVVFGDADFASNDFASQVSANVDLFANSVSWLSGANDLISIRPKDPAAPQTITLDAAQQRVVFFSSVLGVPILILLMGAFVWWRRR